MMPGACRRPSCIRRRSRRSRARPRPQAHAQRAFASTRALSRAELIDAPVRWPRPVAAATPQLELPAKRMAAGMQDARPAAPSGDLLEHLPERQPRGAHGRGAARRRAGDGRRRGPHDPRAAGPPPGHAPARRGDGVRRDRRRCARRSSTSPGWSSATRRARGCCCTARPTRAAASASPTTPSAQPTAQPGAPRATAAATSDAVAHYPAAEGVTSTQILTLVHGARHALGDVVEALPAATARRASGCPIARAALAAMHFPRAAGGPRAGPPAAGLRGAAADPARCSCAAAPRGAARTGAVALADAARSSGRWLERRAAVRADRRPAPRDRGDRRRPRAHARRCSGC